MSTTEDVAKVPAIFEHLAAEGQIAPLRNTNGVLEFDISDGGRWYVNLDHGRASVAAEAERPDCVIACSASDFVAMAYGQQNMMTAYLQGRFTCSGDLALALDFRRLLPVAS